VPKDLIAQFRGEYRFLSNFYPAPVRLSGREYPTLEHAFQAAKTLDTEERLAILGCSTPSDAKRMGQTVSLRPGWEDIKAHVMTVLVRYKFGHNRELAEALLATGKTILAEGNTWGDEFWGATQGLDGNLHGENKLGKILMQIRFELRKTQSCAPEAP